MLWYGRKVNIRRLEKLSFLPGCCEKEVPRDGRCEHGLAQAAKAVGFKLDHVLARHESEVYEILRPIDAPVLVSIDHFSHWITTIPRVTSRHIWVCDSERGGKPILQRQTWREFCRSATYGLSDEITFYLYPLLERY